MFKKQGTGYLINFFLLSLVDTMACVCSLYKLVIVYDIKYLESKSLKYRCNKKKWNSTFKWIEDTCQNIIDVEESWGQGWEEVSIRGDLCWKYHWKEDTFNQGKHLIERGSVFIRSIMVFHVRVFLWRHITINSTNLYLFKRK